MKGLTLLTPHTSADLKRETDRIYEICDGCRRCFNLCPSFNTLFDRIDAQEGDLTKLAPADYARVVDECYYCKLCYNHCPYTPPHQYVLDFPQLMIAWKQQKAREQGVSWRDRLLIRTDFLGRVSTAFAGVANRALRTGWIRALLESVLGIHRERHVLAFHAETFSRWWRNRSVPMPVPTPAGKVALFASCLVNYQATDVGRATVQVLEKNGVEVVLPDQRCCGMPSFDTGDVSAIQQAARANLAALLPWIEQGYDVVVPVPSCSLMFKREYPALLPGRDAQRVAERTFDVCEYLMRMKKAGTLSADFVTKPGRVAYQVPCHLRDQNIGFKSKDLMETAGAEVQVIERCAGHDGTWGAKKEFFELSMNIASKVIRDIEQAPADVVASDCPLAGLQLDQAGAATPGFPKTGARHPIQIVRDAYGLPSS